MQGDITRDELGRQIHVTPGRSQQRTVGRSPEELMRLLRERGMIDQARWNAMYTALLHGAQSEEAVEQARTLADYAYAHAWHVENPMGLAG